MLDDASNKRDDDSTEDDASSEGESRLDQDAIDELLAAADPVVDDRREAPDPAPAAQSPAADESAQGGGELLDQADLDALFGTQALPPASETLNQSDIDASMGDAGAGPASDTAEPTGGTLYEPPPGQMEVPTISQDEIDAIIAAGADEAPAPPHPALDPEVLAQAERLMESASAGELGPVIDQAELDQLLAEADRERAAEVTSRQQEREMAEAEEDTAVVEVSQDEALAPVEQAPEPVEAPAPAAAAPRAKEAAPLPPDEPQYPDHTQAAVDETADPDAATLEEEDDVVSDEVLAALMAAADDAPAPGFESRDTFGEGAEASPPEVELSSDPPASAPAPELAEERPERPRRFWQKGRKQGVAPGQRIANRQFARLTGSIAAGLLAGVSTFTSLYIYQERVPEFDQLSQMSPLNELETAMANAQTLLSQGDPSGAVAVLEPPLARAAASPLKEDAQFLRLEAQFRTIDANAAPQEAEAFLGAADQLLASAQTHPRAPEILYWKGQVYESMDMRHAAQDAYARAIDVYGDAPMLDRILADVARLELSMRATSAATEHARRLLQQFPGSAYADEARLLLADAYNQANLVDEAQAIYARIAERETGNALGAEAFLRLAELALEQGDEAAAIQLLEDRLTTAMTTEGNDRVYLLLGQAQRQAGQLEAAEASLNDVVTFYPNSPVLPRAYVELTQVLDAQGRRDEALRIARQSAARFPNSPQVLANAGELYGLAGQPLAAADTLMAADTAGANDPALLLTAARHYKTAGDTSNARDAYDLLRLHYPRSPQAITGSIEEASVMYDQGQVTPAVERLENLLLTLKGEPQQLLALRTLSDMYEDLGLTGRVQELAREAAGISTEPEVLAATAQSLLRTGSVEEGQSVAARLPLTAVNDYTAYGLLVEQGKALLAADPQRGVELLEQAYLRYPHVRTAEGDQALLEAYIGTNRRAAARRMVAEIQAETMADPVKTPLLLKAAVSWADALYEAGDHRGAAEAYAMAADAGIEPDTLSEAQMRDVLWARYQRANMLLQSSDFQQAFQMYQDIATSTAPWAQEAAMKADYVRMQLRLRGLPAPEEGAQG